MLNKIIEFLQCPSCGGDLKHFTEKCKCAKCEQTYENKNGAVVFVSADLKNESDSIVFRLKCFLKKYPKLFFFIYYTLGVFTGKSVEDAIKDIPEGSLIINVASGVKFIREDVVNIDLYPFRGIHIAADAQKIPFKDTSCDAVICETSLEHIKNPVLAVGEMRRVLKQGGLIYITIPFIMGFHNSPGDYYRWTKEGVRELFKDFHEKEIDVYGGPTYALTSILRDWLSIIFSFNSESIYQILSIFFLVVLAPFNFLDYIFSKYKPAQNAASSFYFIGTKK